MSRITLSTAAITVAALLLGSQVSADDQWKTTSTDDLFDGWSFGAASGTSRTRDQARYPYEDVGLRLIFACDEQSSYLGMTFSEAATVKRIRAKFDGEEEIRDLVFETGSELLGTAVILFLDKDPYGVIVGSNDLLRAIRRNTSVVLRVGYSGGSRGDYELSLMGAERAIADTFSQCDARRSDS